MRLVTYLSSGDERLGFLSGEEIIDPLLALPRASDEERAWFADSVSFIRSGDKGRRIAEHILREAPKEARFALDKVTLRAPIRPSTVLCSGSNYRDHNEEKANTPIGG